MVNIRAAIAERQEPVREVHNEPRLRKRCAVVEWEGTFDKGSVDVTRKQPDDESGPATISPSCSKLVAPCFVNPSLYIAVKKLMRHISRYAEVASYGGTKRQWVALTCDGLP